MSHLPHAVIGSKEQNTPPGLHLKLQRAAYAWLSNGQSLLAAKWQNRPPFHKDRHECTATETNKYRLITIDNSCTVTLGISNESFKSIIIIYYQSAKNEVLWFILAITQETEINRKILRYIPHEGSHEAKQRTLLRNQPVRTSKESYCKVL